MEHGKYTKRLGKTLIRILEGSPRIKVFYDHGGKDDPNTCKPTPYFGGYSRASTLANIDIAIVNENDGKVKVLCEIEEEGGTPKKIIGDVCGVFLAEGIMIKNADYSFDKLHFIFGIKVKEKGKSAEKVKELESRILKIVKPELLDKIKVQFIYNTDYEKLISSLKGEICKIINIA